jgi:hypothetical protein
MALQCLNWVTVCCDSIFTNDQVIRIYFENFIGEVFCFILNNQFSDTIVRSHGAIFIANLLNLVANNLKYTSSKQTIKEIFIYAVEVLFCNNADSIFITWAVNILIQKIIEIESTTNEQNGLFIIGKFFEISVQNNILKVIADSLLTPSYWLRLNLLCIYSYFDPPELRKNSNEGDKILHPVNISSTCLRAASVAINISLERDFVRLIGILEVQVENMRLDFNHLRVVLGFCLGILHVKFKSFWEPVLSVLSSAVKAGIESEDVLWPLLHKNLVSLSDLKSLKTELECNKNETCCKLAQYLNCLSEIDIENGKIFIDENITDSFIFMIPLSSEFHSSNSQVKRDSRTDFDTLFINMWTILKTSPSITLRRSKAVVSLFMQ